MTAKAGVTSGQVAHESPSSREFILVSEMRVRRIPIAPGDFVRQIFDRCLR